MIKTDVALCVSVLSCVDWLISHRTDSDIQLLNDDLFTEAFNIALIE